MKTAPLLFLALLLTACSSPAPVEPITRTFGASRTPTAPQADATPTPFQPLSLFTPTSPAITPTPSAARIWVHPALEANLPPNLLPAPGPEDADLKLVPSQELSPDAAFAHRIYALAAPFPTIADDISLTGFRELWGSSEPGLILTPAVASALAVVWGLPGGGVETVAADRLLDAAWASGRWAIVPFDELEPRWKVLTIDGASPMRKDFNPGAYPLSVDFVLEGGAGSWQALNALYGPDSPHPLTPATNRNPTKLTTVALTGVTALVRATAFTMEQHGVEYPARDIGDWLREADILHVSNEVPFSPDCPFPNPAQAGVVFCSDPRYIGLLESIGVDVVELTGDHFHDWGPEAMLYTLDLYAQHGWPVYGGGADFESGKQAALLEHNGNRIAFIGCNGKGGGFARAAEDSPGSVHCDFDWLHAETARLAAEGYLVIATFQHFEYYTYAAPPAMWADFRGMAGAGAVIVSGSQAHHPHGFEFLDGALIHYGLGNLFFDQLGISPGTEQAFIDRHVFYDGRYLGVELLTIRFEDFARARPMTDAERKALLSAVFAASGW